MSMPGKSCGMPSEYAGARVLVTSVVERFDDTLSPRPWLTSRGLRAAAYEPELQAGLSQVLSATRPANHTSFM